MVNGHYLPKGSVNVMYGRNKAKEGIHALEKIVVSIICHMHLYAQRHSLYRI